MTPVYNITIQEVRLQDVVTVHNSKQDKYTLTDGYKNTFNTGHKVYLKSTVSTLNNLFDCNTL